MSKRHGSVTGNGPHLTVIGRGSLLDGSLEIDHAIHVDGVLRGRVSTPTALIVGCEGVVESEETLEVGRAEINGKVIGRLQASHSVRLGATAQLHGSVVTPRLIIEEGARVVLGT